LTCDFWAKNEKNNFRVGTKVVESVVSARANPAGRNTEILSFAQNDRETTDNGKRNSRSPSGMTARKAIARTTATTGERQSNSKSKGKSNGKSKGKGKGKGKGKYRGPSLRSG
jgi:hypothetical protein